MQIILGIFIVLHGLVHLLYFGQSSRYFELKPGMTWPNGSWVFSHLIGDGASRYVASIFLVLAGFGFIASGIGILTGQSWWRIILVVIAILSSVIFILFWNGRMQNLDGQGVIGVLIDLWLLVMVLVLRWPPLGF